MLNENIRHFRKAKGMSQEEMAIKLNVVRQTISKWEKGLSVPDADVLIHMAELLDVSVSRLLGIETDRSDNLNLSEELEKLNEQLAKINQREKLVQQADEKRGLILLLSIAALLIASTVKNEIISILLVGACMLMSVSILSTAAFPVAYEELESPPQEPPPLVCPPPPPVCPPPPPVSIGG